MGALRLWLVVLAVVGACAGAARASEWENPRETYGPDWDCSRMHIANPTYNICKRCYAEAGTFYWKVPEGVTMLNPQSEFYKGRCEHPEGADGSSSGSDSGAGFPMPDGGADSAGGSGSGGSGGNYDEDYGDDSGEEPDSAHDVVFRICNKSKFDTIYVAMVGPANEEDLGTAKVEAGCRSPAESASSTSTASSTDTAPISTTMPKQGGGTGSGRTPRSSALPDMSSKDMRFPAWSTRVKPTRTFMISCISTHRSAITN